MVKRVRIPLTDVNGNDIMTGNPVKSSFIIDRKEQKHKANEFIKKKARDKNGMVFIDGLGMVRP